MKGRGNCLGSTFTKYNPDLVVDLLLDSFMDTSPVKDHKAISEFMTKIRFKLQELKGLGVKLYPGDLGCKLLSKIIRKKLPGYVNQELARRTSNYPSVNEILENIDDIITMFKAKNPKFVEEGSGSKASDAQSGSYAQKAKQGGKFHAGASGAKLPFPSHAVMNVALPANNTATSNQAVVKPCKFCPSNQHTTSKCPKFKTVSERKARAKQLNLCACCLTEGNVETKCSNQPFPFNCNLCGSQAHIQPFCEQSSTR